MNDFISGTQTHMEKTYKGSNFKHTQSEKM